MKYLAFIFLFLSITEFSFNQSNKFLLEEDPVFPLWLKADYHQTDQTSGISFLFSECDNKYFLSVDDIGAIHLLTLNKNSSLKIEKINFGDYFKEFPKLDFEEIFFDKQDGSVYLSIEGNGVNYKNLSGIYKLNFDNKDILSKKIISIEKIQFEPDSLFREYLRDNVAYEGFAIDNNYFYLGLEGINDNKSFADSTIILIARKSDKKIIKEISTKSIGVQTVCGLYSDNDYSIWGVDRNARKIFYIKFDPEFNILNFWNHEASKRIPGYSHLNYLPSFESITIDDDNYLYIVDDPWKQVFVPPNEDLIHLDNNTINNFNNFIPIIFRYKIKEINN